MKIPSSASGLRDAQALARSIVDDKDYRDKLMLRAKAGELAPAVELALLHYAFGKPVEVIEVVDDGADLADLSDAELLSTIREMESALRDPNRDDDEGRTNVAVPRIVSSVH